jgi:tRNA(Ile)-lysidine synthase
MGLLAGQRGGARIALPGEFEATRSRGRLVIRPAAPPPERVKVRLAVPGRTDYNGGSVQGRWLSGDAARVRLPGKPVSDEFFAAEGLEGGLQVRTGRADERFVPYGARSPVRLRRFLSKQPVPREVRSRPTVLADAGGILWVIGVRRSARAPLSQQTRKALWVHVERHD